MAEWSDDEKADVIAEYEGSNPTPENSSEIIHKIAEKYNKTDNGVRMILVKAGVYVKKTQTTKSNGEAKGTRVNKAEAIDELMKVIDSQGCEVDDGIISKMTGKAAVYFTAVINKIIEG